ncbi:MAG: hypothetical protein HQ537_00510 [Parcubacteria group bacterium]|nr:hypothetical protein [Parcubacteria group bacterium]
MELRRAEISISDSRLEVIEALIYAEKLQLDEDQKIKFTDTLQNIKSRYKNKLDLYQPFLDEYSSIRSSAIADIDRYSKDKTAYESFGLLAIIIAFMMNAWIIYKYTKEN